jgi:Arc/MetJ-type ribon-helix-helix transcriptional regulator
MARFTISMPDEMLKKLDETAREEHRTRSELLREAARRYLSVESQFSKSGAVKDKWDGKRKGAKKMKAKSMTQCLLELGIGRSGCPGAGSASWASQGRGGYATVSEDRQQVEGAQPSHYQLP